MSELNDEQSGFEDTAIAIVGMACRFPVPIQCINTGRIS